VSDDSHADAPTDGSPAETPTEVAAREPAVSESALEGGAYHLTAAFVVFAVGQFVAGRIAEAVSILDLGVLAYALVLVPAVYFAARQFLRGVALVVADVR
jgi:hypothetical protein